MKLLMKLRQSPMKDEYTKDPNQVRSDQSIGEDLKYTFTYRDGIFQCDELNLKCAAQGRQFIEIRFQGGFMLVSDSGSGDYFTSSHFINEKQLKMLKERGLFDEVDIFGCK